MPPRQQERTSIIPLLNSHLKIMIGSMHAEQEERSFVRKLRQLLFNLKKSPLLIPLCLVLLTSFAFHQVLQCGFVCLDDPYFVIDNPYLKQGFSWKALLWTSGAGLFFQSPYVDYWQPMTVLSRILETSCFGLDPKMHHLTNLLLHVLNTLLVFHVFSKLTHTKRASFLIAALFAIHPLHVESVAWVTERKDVLSGFFWLASLWAYLRYVAYPSAGRYMTVFVLFAMGLMSKPMNVTFPVILLVLDFLILKRSPSRKVIFEKIPFFLLSFVFTFVLTLISLTTQVHHLHTSFGIFMENALVSYANYLIKTLFPTRLTVWYYLDKDFLTFWNILGSLLLLTTITLFAIAQRLKRPYFLAGWLWFIIALLPVMSLNDISCADRFTYMPLIGLFWVAASGIEERARPGKISRKMVSAVEAVLVLVLMLMTLIQVSYWKTSISLFEHALSIHDNYISRNLLGIAYLREKKMDLAKFHLHESIRLNPVYAKSYAALGMACESQNKTEAQFYLERALKLQPDSVLAHYNLGTILISENQLREAEEHLIQAVEIQNDFFDARYNLGNIFLNENRIAEAIAQYELVLEIKPDFAQAHNNLGICLVRQNQVDAGIAHYRAAILLSPHMADPYNNLGIALFREKRMTEARRCFEKALQIQPDLKQSRQLLEQIKSAGK